MTKAREEVGSYVTPLTTPKSWLSIPIKEEAKTKGKGKLKSVVVNENFEKIANITDDSFWKEIFDEAAIGKFKKGYSYKDYFLIYKKGKKMDQIKLVDDPVQSMKLSIDFFKLNTGLMSDADIKNNELKLKQQHTNIIKTETTWKNINDTAKSVKIIDYKLKLWDEHDLSMDERAQLNTVLHYGIFLGFFTDKEIIYQKSSIVNIDGLIFDNNTRIFYIDPKLKPKTNKSGSKSKSKATKNTHVNKMIKIYDQIGGSSGPNQNPNRKNKDYNFDDNDKNITTDPKTDNATSN